MKKKKEISFFKVNIVNRIKVYAIFFSKVKKKLKAKTQITVILFSFNK
jgi:hypothetical protein